MFGIIDLSTYIIGTVIIILLPGPNSLYVMSTASRFGQKAGFQAAGGVLVGDTVLMLLTVLGAASLLHAVPMLFLLLKLVGAIYLGWLGSVLLHSAYQRWKMRGQLTQSHALTAAHHDHYFRRALSISLLNPKAILFFMSFFIQFVDDKYPHPAISFFILGVILQLCSLSYLSTLIFIGQRLADFFKRRVILSILGIGSVGLLFFAFALRLLFSSI